MTPERLAEIRAFAATFDHNTMLRDLLVAYDAVADGSALREARAEAAECRRRAGDAEERAATAARMCERLAEEVMTLRSDPPSSLSAHAEIALLRAEERVATYRESARLAEAERVADQEEIATLRADRDEARAEVAMLRGSELVADLHAARADRDMLLAAIAEWHEVGSAPPGPDESAAELARWRRALSALTAIATRHPSPERIADVRANLVPSQARVVAKLAAGAEHASSIEGRVQALEDALANVRRRNDLFDAIERETDAAARGLR